MNVASVTKKDGVSKQLSTSQERTFELILLITLLLGINGKSVT